MTFANVLDKLRADGWSRADHKELIGVVLNEPKLADDLIAAFRNAISLRKILRPLKPTDEPGKE